MEPVRAPIPAVLAMVVATLASAWVGPGHEAASRLALNALRGRAPDFLVEGAQTVAHCSVDPDLFSLRSLPQLRDAQHGDHFLDLELLQGADLPTTRSGFEALCAAKGIKPQDVGTLPYALAEWTQRLTLALAEHRRWPDNPHVRAKALVYAGILAHFAQDLCQPLHTTVHFDGRAAEGGKSPRSGIHLKVDALLHKVATSEGATTGADVAPLKDLLPGIMAEFRRSHALVDRVYEIEAGLPGATEALAADSPAAAFARERLAASARFTAVLILTAWEDSHSLKLPDWHERAGD
jgi:hypothetical protein